jgi:hypothetical protein
MVNVPRKHHYTPVFYLKNFAGPEGLLHIVSRRDGHRFCGTPESIGFEKDFYTIDEADPGDDPHAIERAFAEFEGDAAAVVQQVIATCKLPTDDDRLGILLNFVALAAVRVPSARVAISRPREQVARMVADIVVSSKERFESTCRSAGIDPAEEGVTYESMKRFVAHNMSIHVPTITYIDSVMKMIDVMLPFLAARSWTVLISDQPGEHLVVSDHPVALTWSDGRRHGFFGPGHGLSKTDVTIPLSSRVALLGKFEPGAEVLRLDRQGIAAVNSKTIAFCQRFVAGPERCFLCLDNLGRVVTDQEVQAQIALEAADD